MCCFSFGTLWRSSLWQFSGLPHACAKPCQATGTWQETIMDVLDAAEQEWWPDHPAKNKRFSIVLHFRSKHDYKWFTHLSVAHGLERTSCLLDGYILHMSYWKLCSSVLSKLLINSRLYGQIEFPCEISSGSACESYCICRITCFFLNRWLEGAVSQTVITKQRVIMIIICLLIQQ